MKDNSPVHYCDICLSLKIKTLENTIIDYCGNCGSTNINQTDILDWEEKYYHTYHREHLERNIKLERKRNGILYNNNIEQKESKSDSGTDK